MRSTCRPLLVPLLACLLCAASEPQGDVETEAARRLRLDVQAMLLSPWPQDVAWGAWFAASHKLTTLRPWIARRLSDVTLPDSPLAPARNAVVDAAVRMGVVPPPHVIRRMMDGNRSATTVLLCRHGRDDPAALLAAFELVERESWRGLSTLALGNRMAAWRTPGFAKRVLFGLSFRRTFLLTWDGIPRAHRRPWGSVSPGYRFPEPDERYPPIVWYTLGTSGVELLSPGAYPVMASRHAFHESLDGSFAVGHHRGSIWPRVGWLRTLVGRAPPPPLRTHARIAIKFRGESTLTRAIESHLDDVRQRARLWAEALRERGLLSAADCARYVPEIEYTINRSWLTRAVRPESAGGPSRDAATERVRGRGPARR